MARQGNIQFTLVLTVSAENVAVADNIFKSHAKWMARTHHRSGDKAMHIYDLSKAPEMENPMDPNSGPTGRTQFVISEVYESPAGLQDHWEQAGQSWEDFGALQELMGKSSFLLVNGAKIVHSLW